MDILLFLVANMKTFEHINTETGQGYRMVAPDSVADATGRRVEIIPVGERLVPEVSDQGSANLRKNNAAFSRLLTEFFGS